MRSLITLTCAFVLQACAVPTFAESSANPSFSDSGPDADQYGKQDGYPIGNRFTFTKQRYLVGAFSHFDQFFPARIARRAVAPFAYKRSNDGAGLTYEFEGAISTVAPTATVSSHSPWARRLPQC